MKRVGCIFAAAVALGGCDSRRQEAPKAAAGAPKQVGEAVLALDRATRSRRYGEVCDRLFTRAARRRAGGDDCAALLRSATGDVRRPSVRLLSIEVRGERARARVSARAAGQRAVRETIDLVRERGRYRIASLSP